MFKKDKDLSLPLKRNGVFLPWRSYFFTGLILTGPLALTAYIAFWLIKTVDEWVKPFLPHFMLPETYLSFQIPGYGLLILIIALTALGLFTANLVGMACVSISESLLCRMPVVRGFYRSMKQIFETIFSQSGTSFRKVGLIEYPGPQMWSIVFLSSDPPSVITKNIPCKETTVCVFLPCSPNPTTGFLLYVPKSKITEIAMKPDDAVKLVMSLGLLSQADKDFLIVEKEDKEAEKASS